MNGLREYGVYTIFNEILLSHKEECHSQVMDGIGEHHLK
jgi:hypothetical protein